MQQVWALAKEGQKFFPLMPISQIPDDILNDYMNKVGGRNVDYLMSYRDFNETMIAAKINYHPCYSDQHFTDFVFDTMNVLYVFNSNGLTPTLSQELATLFNCDPNELKKVVFLDAMRTSNSRIPEERREEGLCINQVVCMFRHANNDTYQLEKMTYLPTSAEIDPLIDDLSAMILIDPDNQYQWELAKLHAIANIHTANSTEGHGSCHMSLNPIAAAVESLSRVDKLFAQNPLINIIKPHIYLQLPVNSSVVTTKNSLLNPEVDYELDKMYFPFSESPSSLAQSLVRVGSGRASPFNQGWDKVANFERRHSEAGGLYFKIYDDLLVLIRTFVDATVNDYFESAAETQSLMKLVEFMKKETAVLPNGLVGDLFDNYDTNNKESLKLLVNKILVHTIHQALLHSIDHGYFDSGYA